MADFQIAKLQIVKFKIAERQTKMGHLAPQA